jgi:hypothetical protein
MCGVHYASAVDVHDLEVWWRGFCSVEFPSLLHGIFTGDSSVGYDSVKAAMRTQLDRLFEKIDLGLPVCHIALDEVDFVLARQLLVHCATQTVTLLYISFSTFGI